MTYVVTEACIKCKFTDCVPTCIVDCFYEGDNMLVIHPDQCIDCGACVSACRANAILPDTDPESHKWLELNRKYAEIWPNIVEKKSPPPDAEDWIDKANKYENHFNESLPETSSK